MIFNMIYRGAKDKVDAVCVESAICSGTKNMNIEMYIYLKLSLFKGEERLMKLI